MADLTNKIVSSNFQKLLQKEGLVVQDGTGSATALQLSGSGNVGINHTPVDGYSLFVDGAVSASSLAVNDGTIFIGQTTMSQNSDGGLTFRDSASKELGSFQGDGFFVLSSSLEDGGNGKPLFSMTRQVGSTQNNNVMQVDLTSLKFIQGTVGQNGQWKFGSTPSGSGYSKDFFINDSYTGNPVPGTSINNPAIYITGSTKNIGLGSFSNSTNKLDISGSLLVSGLNGHITASGNISASGIITAEGLVISDDFSLTDDLTVGGNISASGTAHTIGGFTMGSADGTISRNLNLGGSIIHDGDNDTKIAFTDDTITISTGDVTTTVQEGHITASGNISSSGNLIGAKLGINVDSPNEEIQIHSAGNTNLQITTPNTGTGATDGLVLGVGNTTQDGYLWNYENSDLYFATNNSERLRIQNDGNVGIGTTSPTKALQVEGDISASGDIYLDNDKSLIIKNAGGTDVNVLKVDTNNDTILSAPTNEELKLVTNPNATTEGIKFYTDGGTTPNVFIQDGGKVGIGTSSPAGVLQVTSDGSNKFFGVFSASTGAGAYKFYQDSNSHMALYGYNSSGTANVVINTNGASYLKGGNVLIGGSSDNANDKLQVNGSVKTTSHITASGNISSSGNGSFTGTLRADGNVDFNGDLDVAGNINATSLNVTSITSSIVTASIVQTEGSNIFGDTIADTHLFNGHITASGNISASGTTHTLGKVNIDASNLYPTPDNGLALGKVGNEWADLFLNAGGVINFDNDMTITHLLAGNNLAIAGGSLSASGDFGVGGDISASGTIIGGNATIGGSTIFGDTNDDTHQFTGSLELTGSNLKLVDNSRLILGTGNDLQIYHSGTNTFIHDGGTGNLKILASNLDIQDAGGTDYIKAIDNGAVTIYHNGNEKFQTQAGGVQVTGNITASGDISASGVISAGGGFDLSTTMTNGSNNRVVTATGTGAQNAEANLLFDGSLLEIGGKLKVSSHITASNNISASGDVIANTGSFNEINIPADNQFIRLGASQDLQIYHNGSNSFIDDAGTGELRLRGNTRVRLQGMNETNMVSAIQGGGVAVYHNNVEKFLTTAGGINVTGHITASGNISSSIISTGSFGSLSLNNLPTTAIGILTGSLYTLSGSQLGMSGSHEGNEAKILLVK